MNEQTKIGIAIIHCITKSNGAGFDIVYKTDDGKWTNLIDDTGDVFRHIKVNNGAIIRMIKFTTDGWYLCSMKPIVGRDGEYRASWIFFPSDINVEPKDIKNIMEEAELNISRKEFDVSALNTITTKYTDHIIGIPKYNIWATPTGYAIRYTDGDNPSLFDVFGKIYQKEFTRFSWVILMKKEDVDVRENSVSDITSQPLISSKVIQPISDEKFGFDAYVNNQLFTFPQRVSGNETIKVEWKRNGYKDVVKEGNSPEQLSLREDDIYRVIYLSKIKVRDLFDRPIRVDSKVNIIPGQWDDRNQCWFVPKKRISQVTIYVDAIGYEPNPIEKIDLGQKAVHEDIIIRLKKEVHTYNFRIKSSDGNKNIEFTRTSNTKISDNYTPLEGYKMIKPIIEANQGFIDLAFDRNNYERIYQGGSNSTGNRKEYGNRQFDQPSVPKGGRRGHQEPPHPKHSFDWARLFKGFLIFAGGFVVCWFIKGKSNSTNNPNPYQETEVTAVVDASTKIDYQKAIEYLEKSVKFKKSEMDTIDGLRDLWNMLNNYEFDKIKDHVKYYPDLRQSQRFKDLLDLFEKNPDITGSFCRDGDSEITFENYKSTIERASKPKQEVDPAPDSTPKSPKGQESKQESKQKQDTENNQKNPGNSQNDLNKS